MSTPWKIVLLVLFVIYRAVYYIIAIRHPEYRFGPHTRPIPAGLAMDAAFISGALLLFFLRDNLSDIKDRTPKLFVVIIVLPAGMLLISFLSAITFFLTI